MLNEVFFKGDDLTVPVSALVSANTIAGNPVQSGDLVIMGDVIGVATTSAAPLPNAPIYTGYNGVPASQIAIRVKGIFNLPVTPAANVLPGNKIYVDPATGILSDNAAKTWVGWYVPPTQTNINAAVATLVPVKLKM